MVEANNTAYSTYFPVAMGRWEHDFWRLWIMTFPQARVWSMDNPIDTWRDDLPKCKTVVVGIPGIPPDVALDWTLLRKRPTGPEVAAVLEAAKR